MKAKFNPSAAKKAAMKKTADTGEALFGLVRDNETGLVTLHLPEKADHVTLDPEGMRQLALMMLVATRPDREDLIQFATELGQLLYQTHPDVDLETSH